MQKSTSLNWREDWYWWGREQRIAPINSAGVVETACIQEEDCSNTGSPIRDFAQSQPETGDGQAGRTGVADRFVVLMKPGNSGGGKEP